MKHIPDIRALLRHMNRASDFMRWLRAEGESLVASADLLGGRKWAARARAVVEAAKAGNDLAARRGELHELNRLLRLEFTTDIKSVEARRFAAVHPDDPHACEARRCAEAMGRGSRNPREERADNDLGRFGLGLKSASFSQCRRLTVLSRHGGVLSGARWDLDEVAETDRWEIPLIEDGAGMPHADLLRGDGTIVLWEKLDRVDGGYRANDPVHFQTQLIRTPIHQTPAHVPWNLQRAEGRHW